MTKRIIAGLMCLVLLFTVVPVAAFAANEEQATVDTGDVSIEGTNGFGTLLSQEISESQAEADAQAEDYEAGYTVTDLVIEGATATVTYDSMEEAVLVVALYTEDGMQMVTSATATVTADATEAVVEFTGEMPEYFLASAYLMDIYDLSPLCAAYDTPMYTQEMQELLASTVEDYDADRVLNLDDDNTTNFAVYADTTKVIEAIEGVNQVASIDDENATYVIKNADEQITSLTAGDVFVYPYAENEILIVKVAEITTSGTTVTITGDALEMEEAFGYVKIENAGDSSDMTVNESTCGDDVTYLGRTGMEQAVPYLDGSLSDESGFEFGIDTDVLPENEDSFDDMDITTKINVKGTLKVSVKVEFEFYITKEYKYVSLMTTYAVGVNLEFSGTVSMIFEDLPEFDFQPVPQVFIGFSPKLVCSVSAAVKSSFTTEGTAGWVWQNDGVNAVRTKPTYKCEVYFEGTIFVGVDMNPFVRVFAEDFAEMDVTLLIGVELVGKQVVAGTEGNLDTSLGLESSYPDSKHLCQSCLDITVCAKLELAVKIEILGGTAISCNLLNIKLGEKKMYLSMDYGDYGLGTCPHLTYKITVVASNQKGEKIPGAAITVGVDQGTTNGHGAAVFYQKSGTYPVNASYNGKYDSTTVEVEDSAVLCCVYIPRQYPQPGINYIADNVTEEELIEDDSPFSDGDFTNNRYQIFYNTMTWSEAKTFCEGMGGHLATITSAEEQAYIDSLNTSSNNLWIGGYRDGAFNWHWITGEQWTYSNWGDGEPNNSGLIVPETCLSIWPSEWNDLANANTTEQAGFVCEWESETDPSNIPNDYVIYNQSMSWTAAKAYCENLGGHLATITSAEEQRYVEMLNPSAQKLWLGGYRDDDFNWHWVTGEAWDYSNWASGEPNNAGDEKYLAIWPVQWNDLRDSSSEQSGFICEFESPVKEAADLSAALTMNRIDEDAISLNAVYGGEYGTVQQESYTYKIASFSGLVPGEAYVLLALISIHTDELLAADNLLCIQQGIAQEDGTIAFRYVQRIPMEISYVVACGASNKDLNDAEITFPEMISDGELQVVAPTVVYDGVTLTEGLDYTIVGTVDFTTGGTYTCYIRGIHNYTGLVACEYTVAGAEIASGWSGATTWVLTDDGVLTFSGSGNMKNYGYGGGQPWAEYADRITAVVIEDGVTAVGSGAFMNLSKLESVTLPTSGLNKIGEAAFYGSGLTSVEIPASLWTIQPYTFKNCANLTSVKFNEGNLQKISDGAFYGTGLTELVLPDCLDILDVYAFKGCASLTDITIGSGLTELREAVFYGTAIPAITVPEGITKIGPYAFKNCVALETIDLPESLTSVGEASFYACTGLKTVELPDAVTSIGNYAFRKCAAMETLTFGSELTTIGECAFYGCTGLTEIVIPDKVTTIKPYAFKTCTGLTAVTLGSKVATIGEGAFNTCTGLKTIAFPASLTAIGDYAFSGSYNLWQLTFAGDAPAIGTGAFKGLNATAYYPSDNATWTSANMLNYGGKITWKAQ